MQRSALLSRSRANECARQTPAKQLGVSRRITMRQASNMMEAVAFAKLIDLPLVAHLTIHWAYTDIGDDPDGKFFAKVREGLSKWAHRQRLLPSMRTPRPV
jgi:hypothetical protein